MTEMIEKVARSIQDVINPGFGISVQAYRQACSAIATMREPTDAMLAAGVIHDDATYSTWQAMIDEALKET